MLQSLKVILEIQELDIKMIRLMRLKKERKNELSQIDQLQDDLQIQIGKKNEEIDILKKEVHIYEEEIKEIKAKIKHYESQQDLVKKIEEFNALNQEISTADRERSNIEKKLIALADQLLSEEEILSNLQDTYHATIENSQALEEEIAISINHINEEGRRLKQERDVLFEKATPESMHIYERLLNNKRDRVVVPITNRCCSGCHIILTAQQENLVRKAERVVCCEHCSRILYWLESEELEGSKVIATKRRRRKNIAS